MNQNTMFGYGSAKMNLEWARAIRAHAEENYNVSRWDEIVECYTLDEIASICAEYPTYGEALRGVEEMVEMLAEQESNCSYE